MIEQKSNDEAMAIKLFGINLYNRFAIFQLITHSPVNQYFKQIEYRVNGI